MAGGIDWFRWHHGSVSDQKFLLIAKRSSTSVAECIAVWACILEAASVAEDRGNPGALDFESMDCALGMREGASQSIYSEMAGRLMIDEDGRITSWVKRQVKREREDNSADRVAAFRAKASHVTPCNAKDAQETPRGEESRGDINLPNPTGLGVASDADSLRAKPEKLDCPHQEIITLYHEVLPQCPQIRDWTPARAVQLRARWNEDVKRQNLSYWRNVFEYVGKCDFLVGKVNGNGRKPFFADLEWIVKSANFTKIREGKYAND